MNKTYAEHKTLLWTLLIFALVVSLFVVWKTAVTPAQTDAPRINQISQFPREAKPTCDDIQDATKLELFVNGMDTGLRGVGCIDGASPAALFWLRDASPLTITPEANQAVWSVILQKPLSTIGKGRTLQYDIRWPQADGQPVLHLAKADSRFTFPIFEWWSSLAVAAVVLVWGLLIYLSRYSALLRDPGEKDVPLEQRTFSLARAQMAWWFAIIFTAIVFLWLATGDLPALSPQALSLLGLSSATMMASVGISSGRPLAPGQGGVFFHDLLSDANGITMQRFQMLVMTVTLGIMFLFSVVTRLTMPEFDASLLTLLGISAGTYVGLKIPEVQVGDAKAISTTQPTQ